MFRSLRSIGPKITKVNGKLVARTHFLVGLLTLFFSNRQVVVDPARKLVTVTNRWFWFFPSRREIPFEQVRSILYDYKDVSPGSLFSHHDAIDRYAVRLLTQDNSRVYLFSFYGDGAFQNNSGLPDWWFGGEYFFDRTGNQDQESRIFVELLHQMIEAPINT